MAQGKTPASGTEQAARPPRKIVICSDGTGNRAIKGRGTNVFKLYEAVDTSRGDVVTIYDDGIGTQRVRAIRLAAGAFGFGFSRNVRQLYTHLARVYRPGDEIYLFGFSRGAFTVRVLSAMINTCGVLDPEHAEAEGRGIESLVGEAYASFRTRRRALLSWAWKAIAFWKWSHRGTEAWRQQVAHRVGDDPDAPLDEPTIRLIGVWDTVAALGFPVHELAYVWDRVVWPFRFPDNKLTDAATRGRQALAIDEERKTFAPELWEDDPTDPDRVHQVWFPGVHADVGGGYPKQGLSQLPLLWMLEEAHAAGVPLREGAREEARTLANPNGTQHDSRAGLKIYYRYKPRNVHALAADERAGDVRVHASVVRRLAAGSAGYAPQGVPWDAQVVAEHSSSDKPWLDAATGALAAGGSPRDEVFRTVRAHRGLRTAAYAVGILATIALVWFSVHETWGTWDQGWWRVALHLVCQWPFWALAGTLFLAWFAGMRLRVAMHRRVASEWAKREQALQAAVAQRKG